MFPSSPLIAAQIARYVLWDRSRYAPASRNPSARGAGAPTRTPGRRPRR